MCLVAPREKEIDSLISFSLLKSIRQFNIPFISIKIIGCPSVTIIF